MISKQDVPRLNEVLMQFKGKKVLVFGDIMMDQYIMGEVERISPEAPVPVVRVNNQSFRLGGAANVVNNLCELGAKVFLSGQVGKDYMGRQVIDLLKSKGVDHQGIAVSGEIRTTLKTRIIAHNQQVVRVDWEDIKYPDPRSFEYLKDFADKTIRHLDAVIISDYAKGIVGRELAEHVLGLCRKHGKVGTVDPKIRNLDCYKRCTILTPNHHEAGQATGIKIRNEQDMMKAGKKLMEIVEPEALLVTYGERGMVLFEGNGRMNHIDTVARDVYDVTGAGDTVISTLTMALVSGAAMYDAAVLSNFAAGIVVGKMGTATVKVEEILKSLRQYTET